MPSEALQAILHGEVSGDFSERFGPTASGSRLGRASAPAAPPRLRMALLPRGEAALPQKNQHLARSAYAILPRASDECPIDN